MKPEVTTYAWNISSLSSVIKELQYAGPYAIWQQREFCHQSRENSFPELGPYSYLVLYPRRVFSPKLGDSAFDPFTHLSRILDADDIPVIDPEISRVLPPFIGGLIGFFGYDCARHLENIRGFTAAADFPEYYLLDATCVLALDHKTNLLYLVTWPEFLACRDNELTTLKRTLERLSLRGPESLSLSDLPQQCEFRRFRDQQAFVKIVERAQEYIRAGDIFQVVLSNNFCCELSPDPLALYDILLQRNPSPYHFLLSFDQHALVGASPEVMLRGETTTQNRQQVKMRLVAGTYPRIAEAINQGQSLRADPKEQAEHVMLVDHARNDIGRVAQIGSVRVNELCSVEHYADVHHLVSQVQGTLRPGVSMLQALSACFPIATLTGTPKIRAMEIIAELEDRPRGFFGGAMVLLGDDQYFHSCVLIRSALVSPRGTSVQAGAGIVYDSIPQREYEECFWKARPLLDAVSRAL